MLVSRMSEIYSDNFYMLCINKSYDIHMLILNELFIRDK